jgi:hypothetical protein
MARSKSPRDILSLQMGASSVYGPRGVVSSRNPSKNDALTVDYSTEDVVIGLSYVFVVSCNAP